MSSTDLTVRTLVQSQQTNQPRKPATASVGGAAARVADANAAAAAEAKAREERASGPVDNTQLKRDVEQLNQIMQDVRRELKFTIDEDTGETIIRVLDAGTQEVVRQIPSEEVLALMSHLQQQGQSLMVDVKA